MMPLLVFAVTLLIAALLSDLAGRTILSLSVLFLLVGVVASFVGIIQVRTTDLIVMALAEVALVSVLYSDAAKIELKELLRAWSLPGRALFLGMPLTLLGTAVLAHFLVDLKWNESFLLGAILSPTDLFSLRL